MPCVSVKSFWLFDWKPCRCFEHGLKIFLHYFGDFDLFFFFFFFFFFLRIFKKAADINSLNLFYSWFAVPASDL